MKIYRCWRIHIQMSYKWKVNYFKVVFVVKTFSQNIIISVSRWMLSSIDQWWSGIAKRYNAVAEYNVPIGCYCYYYKHNTLTQCTHFLLSIRFKFLFYLLVQIWYYSKEVNILSLNLIYSRRKTTMDLDKVGQKI